MIIIAEDEDANFFLLETWLKDHYSIIRAKNGREAIDLFNQHPTIDLIIMDIKMPYVDGIEATMEIRKKNKHVPIIANTAYVLNEESIIIKNAGCNEILTKPIMKEELFGAIAKYIIK